MRRHVYSLITSRGVEAGVRLTVAKPHRRLTHLLSLCSRLSFKGIQSGTGNSEEGWAKKEEAKKHLCRVKRLQTLQVKKEPGGQWPMSRERESERDREREDKNEGIR